MSSFRDIVANPLKLRLFLVTKLPSAYFAGVRMRYFDGEKANVSVPYKWFSTNPFRSTYFACLAMAAEMSTGLLAMNAVFGRKPPVSMLVVKMEAEYFKKATGDTFFECTDGRAITEAVELACASGESTQYTATATGKSATGELVAIFKFTWSFKQKNKYNSHQ